MNQKSSMNDDLPSTADWYLTDVGNNMINYDFYYKIYCLLMYYSTPNEMKPISKKIYKFFRHLFSTFIMEKIQNHHAGLKFFLPSIVNHDSSIQQQTLIVLVNLFKHSSTSTSSILIDSLCTNSQYLVAYLLALTSSKTSTRQMAISNIKQIVMNEKLTNGLKSFIQIIIDEQQSLILTDENAITILLGRLQDHPIVNELLQTIIFILTANGSKIKAFHKVALLKLLRYCNLKIKSIVFHSFVID